MADNKKVNNFYGLTLERAIEAEKKYFSILKNGGRTESAAMDGLSTIISAYRAFGDYRSAGRVYEEWADHLIKNPQSNSALVSELYTKALFAYIDANANLEYNRTLQKKLNIK